MLLMVDYPYCFLIRSSLYHDDVLLIRFVPTCHTLPHFPPLARIHHDSYRGLDVLLEPAQNAFVVVTQVVAFGQAVTLAGVNYQLCRNISLF